ncbi:MAG: DUF72 domain-containing protein [bacterium]
MAKKGKARIGTSGWHYDHWGGTFYPEDIPKKRFLDYYRQCFDSAEINNSFYQLPSEKTLAGWRDAVPEGFVFAVKGSRYTTHMKKLKDPQQSTDKLFDRIGALGGKLGPVLFQLPPKWGFNRERLEEFLENMPEHFRLAFEFRDRSWYNETTYKLLRDHNAAFCIYELDGHVSPLQVTSDFVYIRLHGPEGPYEGSYSKKVLSRWADRIKEWRNKGKDVYCYFDNDENGYAAQNALELKKLVEGKK